MSDFMAQLAAEAADVDLSTVPTEEGMTRLRQLGEELVETDRKIREAEAQVKTLTERRMALAHREMPDLMAEIGQDRIGLPNAGEHGVDLVSEPYAKASISAEWEAERIAAAFEHLELLGAGDLIKNVVSLQFNRGDHEQVQGFLAALRTEEFTTIVLDVLRERQPEGTNEDVAFDLPHPDVKMSVPWNTLTSYVKEWVSRDHDETDPVMDLEKLGAVVGTIVKIKPRKG